MGVGLQGIEWGCNAYLETYCAYAKVHQDRDLFFDILLMDVFDVVVVKRGTLLGTKRRVHSNGVRN